MMIVLLESLKLQSDYIHFLMILIIIVSHIMKDLNLEIKALNQFMK